MKIHIFQIFRFKLKHFDIKVHFFSLLHCKIRFKIANNSYMLFYFYFSCEKRVENDKKILNFGIFSLQKIS